jgi:transposase
MAKNTVIEIPPEEPAHRLAALRRARDGYLLALHVVVLCAIGRHPTAIAVVLCCSRARVSRTVRAYRARPLAWEHDAQGRRVPSVRPTGRLPTLRRALLARLNAPPRADGWGRTRWRCATLAMTLQTKRGITVSAATRRRWLPAIGWVWQRATRGATDEDPQRVARRARMRWGFEPLKLDAAMVFADDRAIHLWPTGGCAWLPRGPQVGGMTPGPHQKPDLAGALALPTGTLHHCLGARQTHALFRDGRGVLEERSPAERSTRLSVVVANDNIHPATAVEPWLDAHPRGTRRLLPTSGPRATPLERAFGDVQDGCTRNHRRKHLPALVADVEDHVPLNGPWQDKWSELYYAPAVRAAGEQIAAEEQARVAACVYHSYVDRFSHGVIVACAWVGSSRDKSTPASRAASTSSASRRVRNAAFSSSGRKLTSTPVRTSAASSAAVNAWARASARNSSVSVVLNIGGSSELIVTGTPASIRRRIGCCSIEEYTPRQMLLVGQTSQPMRYSAR